VLAAAAAGRGRASAAGVDATAPCGAGRPATTRLLVTAGPSKGSEFAVVGPITTVGRAARNAVVISDISVSRDHLRLERRGMGWLLVDRASGNGTCVNGHVVRRRGLRDGDEIEIGDTALRFLEPGGVIVWPGGAEGSARSLARRRRAFLHGAVAVAVILVVAAAFIRRHRALDEAEAAERRKGLHVLARQKLEQGIALLKEERRGEARAALMIASELDGSDPDIARALQSFEADAPAAAPSPAGEDARTTSTASSAAAASLSHASRASHTAEVASQAVGVSAAEDDGKRALAERHLLVARELYADDDLPRAAAHLRAALESDPENAAARLEMERVVERVRETYLRAYVAKDEDPEAARNGFARVAGALPAGDELAEKAARWLERLDARGLR
jgi:tetratricopeptide (TPR) repeat protein